MVEDATQTTEAIDSVVMDAETLLSGDTADLDRRRATVVDAAKALVVNSAKSLSEGEDLVLAIKEAEAYVHEKLDSGCAKANDLHKHLTGQRNEYLVPLKNARTIAVDKTSAHRRKEEDARRAKEAALREAARKEAEEAQLAEAAQLEKAGRTTEADAVINEPVRQPIVSVAPTLPKSEVRYTERWHAEVTDVWMVPREYLEPKMSELNAAARRAKTTESHIPGVAFKSTTGA